jgi:beta-mannanase
MVSAMKAVDPSLLFVWNPNGCQTDPQTISGNSAMLTSLAEWYPGNSSVDIIAADAYDTDCTNSKLVSQEGWSTYASAQDGGGTSLN